MEPAAAARLAWRTLQAVRILAMSIVVAAFAVMMIAVLIQVGGRYVFNYSIGWTEEIARFAQIWMVLIGAGIAAQRGQHVAVDTLVAMLPLWPARLVAVVVAAGSIWFLSIVAFGSLALIRVGTFQTSSALLLPMWVVYLCLPAGAAYFSLEIVLGVIRRWNRPFGIEAQAETKAAS